MKMIGVILKNKAGLLLVFTLILCLSACDANKSSLPEENTYPSSPVETRNELPLPPETALTEGSSTNKPIESTPAPAPETGTPYGPADGKLVYADPGTAVYSDYHPVVIDTYLIGGSIDGKWIPAGGMEPLIKGNEKYSIVNGDKPDETGYGSTVYYHEASGSPDIDIVTGPEGNEAGKGNIIYYSGTWDPVPKKAVLHQPDKKLGKSLAAFLKQYDIDTMKPETESAYDIDIDNDGQIETFVSATYFKEKEFSDYPSVNDYSVVFAIKTVNGQESYIPILVYIWDKNNLESLKYENRIFSFADLNGDGGMEFIASSSYYEGFEYIVFEVKDDHFAPVISGGDGA